MTEQQKLRSDLEILGVRQGDSILVHSSMKALGTRLDPQEVIGCLQEAVGPEGTLLMPALTYENVTSEHPVFIPGMFPGVMLLLSV